MKNAFAILVVDDDSAFREFITHLLKNVDGVRLECCADGDAAEALLKQTAFNLVCLDLKMPGKDGWEVLRFIRRRDASLPVLILSGLAAATTDELAGDAFTRFAEKPDDLAMLDLLVRQHIDWAKNL